MGSCCILEALKGNSAFPLCKNEHKQQERPPGCGDSQDTKAHNNICVRGAATAAAVPLEAPYGSIWFGDNPSSYGNTWLTSGERGNGGKGCPSNGVSLRLVPRRESHGIGSSPLGKFKVQDRGD